MDLLSLRDKISHLIVEINNLKTEYSVVLVMQLKYWEVQIKVIKDSNGDYDIYTFELRSEKYALECIEKLNYLKLDLERAA